MPSSGRAKNEADLIWRSYEVGHKKWHVEDKAAFKVIFLRTVCGQLLTVITEEEKEAIRGYMRENGWGHTACHNQRQ